MSASRKKRALSQRILFVDYRSNDSFIQFEVLGTKGNSYHVKFCDKKWSCTCPDYRGRPWNKNHQCKHIFFVLARVLHVKIDGKNDSEEENKRLGYFQSVNEVENTMISNQISQQFIYDPSAAQRTPTPTPPPSTATSKPTTSKVKQRNYVGEDCGICFDTFTSTCEVYFCDNTCGKSVHQSCFQTLVNFKQKPLCPYCRADMLPDTLVLPSKRRRVK